MVIINSKEIQGKKEKWRKHFQNNTYSDFDNFVIPFHLSYRNHPHIRNLLRHRPVRKAFVLLINYKPKMISLNEISSCYNSIN